MIVVLAFAGSAQAAPAFVQGASNSTSGTSMTVSYGSSVGTGHLLVGMFRAAGTTSVSDSLNGAWTEAVGASDAVNSLWYKANAKAGSTTVTVSASTSGPLRAVVADYSGIATSSPLGGTACNTGTSTTATTGSTASVPAGELAFAGIGMFESPITVTAGSGATLRTQFTGSNGTSGDEDVLSTVAGAQNVGFGLSASPAGGWAACIATFKVPAPVNTSLPVISGSAQQGGTLTTTNGSWSNSPTSYTYQWKDCDTSGANCTNISGATSNSYVLGTGDVGHTIRVVVTAANSGGSTPATSAQTGVVTGSACTQTLSPGADVGSAVSGAAAGSVICLNAGTYTAPSIASSHGTSTAHVTLTSTNRSSPATLTGRFTMDYTASYIDLNHLKFTPGSSTDETAVISSANNTFTYNDISGGTSVICLVTDSYNGYAADNMLVDHNTIHDCGDPTNTDDQIHAQGVYSYGATNVNVSNNWCWNVAARCYQIAGGTGGTWKNNVADDANWGFIFGELTPTSIAATNNITGPDIAPTYRYSTTPGTYGYGGALDVYMPGGGSGDTFANNCISSQNSQIYGSDPGLTVSNNTVANVQFVNAAGHNYAVASGSPCQGYGAQGTPGP